MKLLLAVIAVLALAAHLAAAADFAVIVAGSNGYDNYRHQADACHAYQVLHANGVPDSNIIMMYYDDIANDPSNPYPGKLFNKPTAAGTPGVDVYGGCKKDYTGNDATAANFLAIITGNSTAVPKGKPVLKSGAGDRVFVNFVDHGGTGLICFPTGDFLYSADLNKALVQMHTKKMYKKLVFYLEACESGSMFEGLLPTNLNIYTTTAANAAESSWGTYCPPQDMVNGKSLDSCLGDTYSVNWMENADAVGPLETLQQQFLLVKNLTDQSHVMQYGDVTWTSDPIGDFEGNNNNHGHHAAKKHHKTTGPTVHNSQVNSRDIRLHNLYYRYLRAPKLTNESLKALKALTLELEARADADALWSVLGQKFGSMVGGMEFVTSAPETPFICDECCKMADAAMRHHCSGFTDYSLQYHYFISNTCSALGGTQTTAGKQIVQAIVQHCGIVNP